MHCPRLLPVLVVLFGLVGVAQADHLRVIDPQQIPTPTARAFGNVNAGATANATITIASCNGNRDTDPCDTGGGGSTLTGFTPGAGCAEFSVTTTPPPPNLLITNGPANAVVFNVRYQPTNHGPDTCTFTAVALSGGTDTTTFTVTGTGMASLLQVQTPMPPNPLTFVDQLYNTGTGETKNITVVNAGNVAIAADNIMVNVSATTHFAVGALTPAVAGFPIEPGETATLPVTFNPTSVGDKAASITFVLDNDGAAVSPVVNLTGKGVQSIATVPASVVFAAGAVGAARDANLAVMNTGDAPLTISTMTIALMPDGGDFAFTDHGCTGQSCAAPGVIAAGATSTFVLRCTPGAAGLRAATMTIASDDGTTGLRTVALKCTANNLDLGVDKVGPPATAPQLVSVANGSQVDVTYSVASSVPAEFAVTCAGNCNNRVLAAGARETVSVTFQAAAAGARTANLTFTTTDPQTTGQFVVLTGTGTRPAITVPPGNLVFGDVPVIQAGGTTRNLTIANDGLASLVISSMSISGDAENNFSFAFGSCAGGHLCSDSITVPTGAPPANQTTITLRCDPTSAGAKTANLVITSDAPTSPTTVPLTCTGTVPDVVVSTLLVDFDDQRVGVASAPPRTFTVSNSAAAQTAAMAYAVSVPAGEFAIACSAPGCAGTLAAGASITVSVTFTPQTPGPKLADITVATPDDPDEPMTTVMLIGNGTEPTIAVPPGELAFGDVPVVLAGGATADLIVSNGGEAPLTISAMAITGDPAGTVTFATAGCVGGQTCDQQLVVDPGAAPGNQEAITLRCDPAAAGLVTATLTIVSDAPTSPTQVTVTCTGTVPDVQVSETTLAFGDQRVGTTSAIRTFTVSNAAAAHTAPLVYTVAVPPGAFAIACSAPGCTGTLAAGAQITVSVTFAPVATGAQQADITVTTAEDPDQPTTVVLVTGTGTQPVVVVDVPASGTLALGDVDVGATSAPGTITLRNGGGSDLAISGVTLVGANADQFAIATGATGAQTLSSGAGANTRSWTVTCSPTSIGAKVATFRVTHDAPILGSTSDVALTCTGRAATFTASVVPPAKLDFGQVQVQTDSAPLTFTLTNAGNKAGRVTMLTSTSNVFVATTMANLAQDIAPGASITVRVVFHPVNTLVANGQVCGLNTGLVPTVCVDVTGDGQSIGLDVSPAIDFGAVRFDAAPVTSGPVTITNTGESSLRIDSITSGGAPFTVVNGPALPVTLSLNQTAIFRVRLTPTPALGTVMQIVTVGGVFTVSGAMASSTIPVMARITAPQVSMTADMIDFGPLDIDAAAPLTRSVMITNTSDAATGADLNLAAPVLESGAADFTIVGGAAAVVAPGGSTTLTVRFDPSSAGPKAGQVSFAIDAVNGMIYTVTLRGLAIDQNVVCNPMTITFPPTVRRQDAEPIAATVTNIDFATGAGTAAMLTYTATITGPDAGDFSLPAADATGAIAGNGMKSLPIGFRPAAAGGRTASLVVTYDDNGPRSCTVPLIGDGRLRLVSATPPTGEIDFGTVALGTTVRLSDVASVLQLTSMEPAGATAVTVTRLTLDGDGAAAFTVLDGDVPRSLTTGMSLLYDVEFHPDAEGVFAAEIDVFFDDDPEVQHTFRVTGRAVELDLHGGGCDGGGGGAGFLVGLAALGLALVRRRAAGTAE